MQDNEGIKENKLEVERPDLPRAAATGQFLMFYLVNSPTRHLIAIIVGKKKN